MTTPTVLTFQENLSPEMRWLCWRDLAGPPPVDDRQDEAGVAAWLDRLQAAGALVILKKHYVSMLWGDSAAWTVGIAFAPCTDTAAISHYGMRTGPRVRGVHLQERTRQISVNQPRPHVGGTTNCYHGRRIAYSLCVWAQAGDAFKFWGPEGPPDPLGDAPNGWDQAAYETLARTARSS